ncbi:MAG: tRNA pseudouridine55 synthase [Planctomycetota bacterium]
MARQRGRKALGPGGIILIDKPVGPTSRNVVDDLRRQLDLPGPGHCGTLDPLASGLLILVAGHATRIQDRLTGHDKTYEALVVFGASSLTDDAEGPFETEEKPTKPDLEAVKAVVREFVGVIEQTPPMHSAIRVDGERLYKAARRGETKEIPSRHVEIHSIDVVSYVWPNLNITVDCGSGTYIRSLARDLGEALGTKAHLGGLRRTRCGTFQIKDAKPLDDIEMGDVLSLEACSLGWPRVEIPRSDLALFLTGRPVEVPEGLDLHDDALVCCDGQIVGRSKKLGERTLRMNRLIRRPFPT